MIQGRGTPRLIFKSAQLRLVCRQAIGEKLERSFAPESLVAREINLAHSANADQRLDSIMTNHFSNQCAGRIVSHKLGSDFEGRQFNKILRLLMRGEQRLHLAAQAFVTVASLGMKCGSLPGRTIEG